MAVLHPRSFLAAAAVVLMLGALPTPADAQTVTVTNTNDSGAGSLRAAVEAINAGTADAIDLTAVSGSLTLLSPLPSIANPVTITGAANITIGGGALGEVLIAKTANVTITGVNVAGALTKSGPATLTWNGATFGYSGDTTLLAGTFRTSTDWLLSATSPVVLGAGALLDLTNTRQEIASLAGDGSVDFSGGELSVIGDQSTTFGGTLTGAAANLTKNGTGTFTIDGGVLDLESFTIDAGIVDLLTGGAVASVDGLFVADGATLTLGADQTAGDLNVEDGGLVDLGAHTLTLGGAGSFGSIISGVITGDGGSLHVTDDVQMMFGLFGGFGSGTYTGSTRVSGNAYLGLFGDQVLSAQTGLVLEDNGIIEVDGVNTFASLSGTGGELWLCDCTELTIDQDIDTTFAGALLGDMTTTFTKAGSGRLYLTGDSSLFLGTMNVTGGTLAGTTNSLIGDITNNATLEFDQNVDGVFGGAISGTGSVVKSGTGAVTFDMPNTYTGGTVVNAGTLIVEDDDALGNGSLTMNGGTLQVDAFVDVTSLAGAAGTVEVNGILGIDQDIDTTFGGIFTGALGSVEKLGTGMLTLTGTSTFGGAVSVLEGTLALGGTNALASAGVVQVDTSGEVRLLTDQTMGDILLDGTLAVGAQTLTVQSGSFGSFLGGNITGTGAIVVDGLTGVAFVDEHDFSGSLTLQGTSSSVLLVDNAIVNVSSVAINDDAYFEIEGVQRFGSLSGNGGELFLCDCAELTVDQAADGTFAGALSGDASAIFTKAGTGRLMLAGDSSGYLGAIEVDAGVLAGTTMSLVGDITNDATLEFDQTFDGDFTGMVSGTGAVVKSGSGVVTMAGDNDHTGGTIVNAGTLIIDEGLALGDGALTMNGGTLQMNDLAGVTALGGAAGTLELNSILATVQSIDTTFGGTLAGSGTLVKAGSGTLTLTGTSSFSGAVEVEAGALALGGANALAGAGLVYVSPFAEVRLLSDQTIGGLLHQGTLAVGAHTLTLDAVGGVLFAGNVTGTGAIVVGNATSLWIDDAIDFAGSMAFGDDSETLLLADNGIANVASVAISGNAYVEVEGMQRFGSLSGTGGELFLCDCAAVTVDQQVDGVFAGMLTGDAGSTFIKDGAARLTLAGDGSMFFGTIQVIDGVLRGTTTSLTGDIANSATVEFFQDSTGTFGGAITGTGSVIKNGAGTLFVTGGFNHTGGTLVLGGTLAGSALHLEGDIENHAVVNFIESGSATFDGTLSGTGEVIKSGGGTLTIEGAHGYTGGTTIAGGTLLIGSDASLGSAAGALTFESGTLGILAGFASARDVILAGGGTIDTGDSQLLLSGALTGAGGLTKIGSGQLWLTGTASHTGGTRVLEGLLGGDTATLQGGIVNQAVVMFDQAFDGTFDGVISGTGQVAKLGDGQLTIAGTQTYTGETIVAEGGLRLDGSLAGPVVVFDGATFGGSGTVAGEVLVAGTFTAGWLPGGAGGGGEMGAGAHAVIPPMTITGNLLLTSDAVYQAQVDEDASIATLQVSGLALVEGATLQLFETAAGIDMDARRTSSTVLTAAQIIGSFGSVTGLDGAFDPYFFVSDNALELLLVRTNVDFAAFASSVNGSEVGAALAAAAPGASGDLAFVTRELSALETDAELAAALDRLSGAAHASVAGIGLIGTADAIDVLMSRFDTRAGWWLQALGSNVSLETRVDPLASSAELRGAMAGYDRVIGRARIGIAGGYQDTGIDATGGLDRIDGRAIRGAAYGEYRAGRAFVDVVAGAASHAVRGSRGIDFAARLDPRFGGGLLFGGVSRSATFDYDATELTAVADAGYGFAIGPLTLQPAAGVQVTRFAREGFAESGAGSLDLTAGESTVSSTAARARLSLERRVNRAAPRWFAPRASVRYTHALGDRAVPFTAAIAGEPFTAHGFALPGSLLAARAGFAAGLGRVSVSLDYRAAFAAGHRHHLVSAGFGF